MRQPTTTATTIDELKLKEKLKALENETIYLDFLFSNSELNATLKAIILTERNRVDETIKEAVVDIYKKIHKLALSIDPNDEKQLNLYSDNLKTPIEKENKPQQQLQQQQRQAKFGSISKSSDSFISSDSALSIKLISKKTVLGRMYKYKADLYACINQKEDAIGFYIKALSACKKEQDLLWMSSAQLGLVLGSYYYFNPREGFSFTDFAQNSLDVSKPMLKSPSSSSSSSSKKNLFQRSESGKILTILI